MKRYNKLILSYLILSNANLYNLIFSVYHSSSAMHPGCQRLFMSSFRFWSSLKKSPAVFLAASPLLSSAFGRGRVDLRPTKVLIAREKKPLVPRVFAIGRDPQNRPNISNRCRWEDLNSLKQVQDKQNSLKIRFNELNFAESLLVLSCLVI